MTIGASSSTPHITRSSSPSRMPRTGWSASSKRTANSSTAASSPGGSTIATARRTRSASEIRVQSVGIHQGYPSKLDHRTDAVLVVHELEPVVDVLERDPVRDERVHVELAVEVELNELRDLVAAFDAAEGGARDPPAGDEQTGDDVERLPLAGHARDRAQPPAHPCRLDGLA